MSEEEPPGKAIISNFMDVFITPEVMRRQAAGELDAPLDLRAVQIVFRDDGRRPEVRVNAEVQAVCVGKPACAEGREPGQVVYENDVGTVERIELLPGEEDCGHFTMFKAAGTWHAAFDFHYNQGMARTHVNAAEEFFRAASYAITKGDLRAGIYNLFCAAELAAKATLLTMPGSGLRGKADHRPIHAKYQRAPSPLNVPTEHVEVFNWLYDHRKGARYLTGGELPAGPSDTERMVLLVRQMIDHAASWAGLEQE